MKIVGIYFANLNGSPSRGEAFIMAHLTNKCLKWLLLAAALGLPFGLYAKPGELVFLNWADNFIDPVAITEFETAFKIKVRQVYFETEDKRTDMLIASDGKGYDVALIGGHNLQSYGQHGWLAPLETDRLPNLQHIDPRWRNAFPSADTYGVPFLWGTLGIAYREDLLRGPLEASWKPLFQPPVEQRGHVLMMETIRYSLAVALKALGYSANSINPTELAAAEQLLKNQRPFVKQYGALDIGPNSEMVSGQITMALLYNGDALKLREFHPHIRFVTPREGTLITVDYFTVLAKSLQKELAHAFINFMNEPARAAQLAEFAYYPTANRAAEPLLPPAFHQDPDIYPKPDLLNRSEIPQELPPRVLKQLNQLYRRVVGEPINRPWGQQ